MPTTVDPKSGLTKKTPGRKKGKVTFSDDKTSTTIPNSIEYIKTSVLPEIRISEEKPIP